MLGSIYNAFLEMVATRYSERMAQQIAKEVNPDLQGRYALDEAYPDAEMIALVSAFCEATGKPASQVLQQFGRYLFAQFAHGYSGFFLKARSVLHFMAGIEEVIHARVRHAHADAQPPRFDVEWRSERELVLTYRSARRMEDLADGMIRACIEHFGEHVTLTRHSVGEGTERAERFVLLRHDPQDT